jgi:hypothetical protein
LTFGPWLLIVLLVGSMLVLTAVVAGVFSVTLGVIHWWVPRIFAFGDVIGKDPIHSGGSSLGIIRLGGFAYVRRRSDAIGLTWVMSNAASYVLITIGVVDLAWAVGDRTIPLNVGAAWIAGWWTLRAAGQFAVGHRRVDVAVAIGFAALAALHLALILW